MYTTWEEWNQSGLRGHTVLVIDDEPANLAVVSEYLHSFGLEGLVARDGKSGLEKVQYSRPDLILLDILMPGMDGFETCRRLKADEALQNIPVIFMTALTETQDKVEGFRLGAVDYITKPFQYEELLARVSTHLRLHELTERLEEQVRERTAQLAKANQELSSSNSSLRREIEGRVRAEESLHKINRAYKALSECNQAMIRATGEMNLLQEACRIIVEDCMYHLVWIGLAEQDEAKTVRPVAQAGYEEGYLDTVEITWADSARGHGPTGTAIRTGTPVINQDILTHPDYTPWRADALERGYAASAAFPLITGEQEVIGALNVYAAQTQAFVPEEVALLMQLAGDLAYGITSMRARADHRRAEEALRESEELHRITMENILDAVFITDDGGKFTFICANLPHILGYTVEEIQAEGNISRLLGEGLFDLDELKNRGEIHNVESALVDKYGQERAVLVTVKRVSIKGGTILYTIHDITDRKQAEEALARSESRLRGVLMSMDDLVFVFDREARFTDCYAPDRELYLPSEAFIGKKIAEVMSPDIDCLFAQAFDECKVGNVAEFEYRLEIGSGIRWYAAKLSPMLLDDVFVGVVAVVRDITRRKQSEKTLKESEERWHRLVEYLPAGSVVHDGKQILYANRSCLEMSGAARAEDVIGKPVRDFVHPDYWGVALERVRNMLEHSQYGPPVEQVFLRMDGAPIHVEVTAIPQIYMGRPAVQTVFWDISERKRVEEELRAHREHLEDLVEKRTVELQTVNRELESFAYSVSHDLRTPLRAMDGFSHTLLQKHGDELSAQAQHYLQRIHWNAQQMDRLIDDLLAFSRLGRQPLRKRRVAPTSLVCQALEELSGEQEDRQVEVQIGDLPSCWADRILLKQVFVNLLSNALKFTRRRQVAHIEVGCRQEGSECVYFVRDNGVGFDTRYIDKLFGVFQRLHRAEEYEGTGVGLANVQRIVHRHGGRVWAESEEDQGATFYFTLGGELQ